MRTIQILLIMFAMLTPSCSGKEISCDTFTTSRGPLKIYFIGHATLMLEWNGLTIHVDPCSSETNYSRLPKADLILVTHQHTDHFDPDLIHKIRKENTSIVWNAGCAAEDSETGSRVMKNGDHASIQGVDIEVVPAYNLLHKRPDGKPFHPRGEGIGYVLTLGDTRIYIAGDTENIPELSNLKDINIAFLPMNLPYTMTPEMTAEAARMFHPAILYPYHYSQTDPSKLTKLLKDSGIEVRIRPMK